VTSLRERVLLLAALVGALAAWPLLTWWHDRQIDRIAPGT
jgi:hypothetical protein